jgi:hypothetical protein
MKLHSSSKMVLAIMLSISLLATGCSAQWITIALADLPVLVQMSLNIGTLVTTLQSNRQLTTAEAAAIQNISAETSRDLNLLQTLYNDYKANPNASALQKIQVTIADMNQSLPAILQAAHIIDPILTARVSAAVSLILSTVNSFASLIPQAAGPAGELKMAVRPAAIPHAEDLKDDWNRHICGPTGRASLDASFTVCPVR